MTFSQCLHFALIFFPDVFFLHLIKIVRSSPKSTMTQIIDSKYYVKYKFASKFIQLVTITDLFPFDPAGTLVISS